MLGDGYGKIFKQIYAGTLRADWKAMITFEQMIVLCDSDGMIDMPIEVLHNITGIPVDIIQHGIAVLESPDLRSRSPEMEGRRIVRLDDHRDWGWKIVNHKQYRDLSSRDDRREYMREYMRKQRVNKRKQPLAHLGHTDTDTDTYKHTDDSIVLAFEEFWKAYPKRKGGDPKKPARSVFTSAVKNGADPKAILRGAQQYAKECTDLTDMRFVCQAQTWLRQERWNDVAKAKNHDQFKGAL